MVVGVGVGGGGGEERVGEDIIIGEITSFQVQVKG